jgi:hypothetical protein
VCPHRPFIKLSISEINNLKVVCGDTDHGYIGNLPRDRSLRYGRDDDFYNKISHPDPIAIGFISGSSKMDPEINSG